MTQNFQVHLQGLINLLSNHLYSAPRVFMRELLQNATDAITARRRREPEVEGRVHVQVFGGTRPKLVFEDNGIGLTQDEIEQFLSSIGASTKRDAGGSGEEDFIGQFGIGLLSCFMVTEEIVMVTRSATGGPALEWRGREDGTFTTTVLEEALEVGTRVYLTAKAGAGEFFRLERAEQLLRYYGDLLPFPVYLSSDETGDTKRINSGIAPFEREFSDATGREAAMRSIAREQFNREIIDTVPLQSRSGKTRGVAFILQEEGNLADKPRHKVYLKRMLVSDKNDDILPQWAFFVQAIINSSELRPTASREGFYQDETLEEVRRQLGRCIRNHLVQLHQRDPKKLRVIIESHRVSMKMLARDDEELYRILIHYLRFPTTLGPMSIRKYLRHSPVLYHMNSAEEFNKLIPVARAQNLPIINSRYDFDQELLERLPQVYPDLVVRQIETEQVLERLEELDAEEAGRIAGILKIAATDLAEFRCKGIARKFEPADVPALHYMDSLMAFHRRAEQASEEVPELWGGIMRRLAGSQGHSIVCFNYRNPLVQRLSRLPEGPVLRQYVRLLYLQALLQGNHQLNRQELSLLTSGLYDLLELHAGD